MAFNFIAMINLLNTARYGLSFLAQVEIGNTCTRHPVWRRELLNYVKRGKQIRAIDMYGVQ